MIKDDIRKFQTAPTNAPKKPDIYHIPEIPLMLPIKSKFDIPMFAEAPIPHVI